MPNNFQASFPLSRPRRLRQNKVIQSINAEISSNIEIDRLIYPVFILAGEKQKIEIKSMPGIYRLSLDELLKELEEICELGINKVALFPVIEQGQKDKTAQEAYNPNNLINTALRVIKKEFPNLCLITDVALDPFTKHGHDGICDENNYILNDETINILVKMALCQAEAGADIIAPSDMMDGRILAIRKALEQNKFHNTLIMAYSAKYASGFYGPFREALSSSLQFGDKTSYQLNPANAKEAEKEILLDINEGADLIMVKPGMPYLDIIYRASQISHLPIIAYSVSGEYSMFKSAALNGYLDERKVVEESILCFRRAGCQAVITYYAKQLALWQK